MKRKNHPDYWYWPQCDVDGCEGVSECNGTYWRPGYWCLCNKHSDAARSGKPMPAMKRRAIKRERERRPDRTLIP